MYIEQLQQLLQTVANHDNLQWQCLTTIILRTLHPDLKIYFHNFH